ncbi:hypothetical protein BBJ28_00016488 [Nothophytophthora sp. Chile5]|nr:hypothetical protein BBJ28_00016488 [Nothophytophthora sp. Chile5]
MRAEGHKGILKYTNVSPEEFERIWDRVQDHIKSHWNVGRGQKCRYPPKDVLFTTTSSLKHCRRWDTVARVFKIVPSTFQKMVRKFLGVLSPFLYETYVECADDSWPMGKLVRSGNTSRNFPYAHNATDVTFQQANKPGGNTNEIMRYYSGKHH